MQTLTVFEVDAIVSFKASFGLPYSRKLSRVKTFANFVVLPASAKVLSANFSARGLGERVGFNKTRKFYSRNALLYRIRESFHPRKFPAIRYIKVGQALAECDMGCPFSKLVVSSPIDLRGYPLSVTMVNCALVS